MSHVTPSTEGKKNWKSGLAFSKLHEMPKGNWKEGLKFGIKTTEKKSSKKTEKSESLDEVPKKKGLQRKTPLKPSSKPLKRTPLKKTGARKKARISEYGTESDFYFLCWEAAGGLDKVVKCACGCKEPVKEPFVWVPEKEKWKLVKPQCFSHILAKSMYPRFRYVKENIAIVASFDCHDRSDKKYVDQVVRNEKEKELDLILKNLEVGTQNQNTEEK